MYDFNQQAKQIATIKWLLYKAYNNNVPSELKDPFYYDERQQSMVKTKIDIFVTQKFNIFMHVNLFA